MLINHPIVSVDRDRPACEVFRYVLRVDAEILAICSVPILYSPGDAYMQFLF